MTDDLCDVVERYLRRWSPDNRVDVASVTGYLAGRISLDQLSQWDPAFSIVNAQCVERYKDRATPPEQSVISDLLDYHGYFDARRLALKLHQKSPDVQRALDTLWAQQRIFKIEYGGESRYIAFRHPPLEHDLGLQVSSMSGDVDVATPAATSIAPAVQTSMAATHILPAVKTSPPLYKRVLDWFYTVLKIYK